MRINPDFPIQQPVGANFQKNAAERTGGEVEARDVLAIDSKDRDVRAADRGVRASQDAMTLFRIAEESLSKIEDALVRMARLSNRAAMGDASEAERENMRFEMDDLAETVRFAGEETTMGGVPVFGEGADTAAMWNETMQNVAALSPNDDNEKIAGVAETGLEALGLGDLNIGTKGAAVAAAARIGAAIGKVSGDRETMATQAGRMGEVARDQALRAVAHFPVRSRITDSNAAAGLMAFIRDGIDGQPDRSVLAQARQNSLEVTKINA